MKWKTSLNDKNLYYKSVVSDTICIPYTFWPAFVVDGLNSTHRLKIDVIELVPVI